MFTSAQSELFVFVKLYVIRLTDLAWEPNQSIDHLKSLYMQFCRVTVKERRINRFVWINYYHSGTSNHFYVLSKCIS